MEDHLIKIFLTEACQLELLVADLYTFFEKTFIEDKNFWRQLAEEEERHAELIRTIINSHGCSKEFVSGIAPDLLQEVIKTKELVSSLIVKFSTEKTDRKTAFTTAISIEKSAGEITYQNFMTQEADSWILAALQKLNEYDIDHIKRIEQYAMDNKVF